MSLLVNKIYIDIAAIDHYPETWSLDPCDHWVPLDVLTEKIKKYGKEGAIMETGDSIWGADHDHAAQARRVRCALPVIFDKVSAHNAAFPANRMLIANWYELKDNDSGSSGHENHFGLVLSDWTRKEAYNTFEVELVNHDL